jgi:hypothetical protein
MNATPEFLKSNLGSVTDVAWTKRPELRERIGRGWSRERHRKRRRAQLRHRKVKVLIVVRSSAPLESTRTVQRAPERY